MSKPTLTQTSVKRCFEQSIPPSLKIDPKCPLYAHQCANLLLNEITNRLGIISDEDQSLKSININHLTEVVKQLGMEHYLPNAQQLLEEYQKIQSMKKSIKSANSASKSGNSEELKRQQMALFQQSRSRMNSLTSSSTNSSS